MQVSARRAAAIAALGFAVGGFTMWLWDRPSDLYTCVLHEMRGQPDNMKVVAAKVCGDRFGTAEEN